MLSALVFIYTEASVEPKFSCWFDTYEQQQYQHSGEKTKTKNLVFGYNNSVDMDVTLLFTSIANTFTPSLYNGQQPDIYRIGSNPLEFAIKDFRNGQGSITWFLDQTLLTVNLETDLSMANRCDTLYHDSCAVKIEHFCEDSSFCNGEETCFSTSIFGVQTPNVRGVCSPAPIAPVCPMNSPCDETRLACHRPETPAPTIVTAKPTSAPTKPIVFSIEPVFECWYNAVDESALLGDVPKIIKYLVFGYNNTGPVSQIIPVTTNQYDISMEKNTLSLYNGKQPSLFAPGFHTRAFILADRNQEMDSSKEEEEQGGGGRRLDWFLTDKTVTVNTRYELTNLHLCDAPPTPQFTTQCSADNTDCTAYDTYCQGKAVCQIQSGQCIYQDSNFSPCPPVEKDVPLVMACIEHLSECAKVVFCTSDSQCLDQFLCNGQEYCHNGACVYQNDTSPAVICGDSEQICIEGRGCVAPGYSISNGAIALIVIFGALFLVGLIVAIVLYYYYADWRGGRGGGSGGMMYEARKKNK
jgi:hypothetical protein